MTDQINDGGPAFPVHDTVAGGDVQHFGATLRDYFAAKAMASIVTAMSTAPKFTDACTEQAGDCELSIEDYIAARSYDWADAMLKARQS